MVADLMFQIGYLLASLRVVSGEEYEDLWENDVLGDGTGFARVVLQINVWLTLAYILAASLASAFSRSSKLMAAFGIVYVVLYVVVLVLVGLWIPVALLEIDLPEAVADRDKTLVESFKGNLAILFGLRLGYFLLMTFGLGGLLVTHLSVQKSKAQE